VVFLLFQRKEAEVRGACRVRSRAPPVADEASVTKCLGRQARCGCIESPGTANGVAKQLQVLLPLPFISKMLDMQNHSEFSLWFFVSQKEAGLEVSTPRPAFKVMFFSNLLQYHTRKFHFSQSVYVLTSIESATFMTTSALSGTST